MTLEAIHIGGALLLVTIVGSVIWYYVHHANKLKSKEGKEDARGLLLGYFGAMLLYIMFEFDIWSFNDLISLVAGNA